MGLETALAVTAATAGVASGAMSIIGGISQYNQQNAAQKAAQQAAEYDRQNQVNISNYNASIANQNAKDALAESREQEERKRMENERLLGMQRALYGKSGAALYSGSPLAVLGDTAANNEMEALDIRREGVITANNYRSEGNMFSYQGRVAGNTALPYKQNYTGSLLSGIGGGVGQIMNAGANLYNRWPTSSSSGNNIDPFAVRFMSAAGR